MVLRIYGTFNVYHPRTNMELHRCAFQATVVVMLPLLGLRSNFEGVGFKAQGRRLRGRRLIA